MSRTATAWLDGALLFFASIYLGLAFTEVVMLFPGAVKTTKAARAVRATGLLDRVRAAVAATRLFRRRLF